MDRSHEGGTQMRKTKRLTVLGSALAVIGLGFAVAGGVAYAKVQDGYDSLQAFSEAQDVQLNYHEDGELVDRGSVEEAQAIMSLLTDDWQYPVVESDFDPANPLVNTASEYMYQMATINYHVLNDTIDVVIDEAVTLENGDVIEAGTYQVPVDGRYWTDFDRSNPIDASVREQAWTGTVHGLVGELGVGTVTHSTLQMGLALAALFAGVGLTLILTGAGMVWVARGKDERDGDTVQPVTDAAIAEMLAAESGKLEGKVGVDN
jgi:hypothetical protein